GRARNNRPGVAHATSRRGGLARNEAYLGLGHPLLYELRGLLFVGAADLADHDHGIGRRVCLEGRQAVDEVRPDQRIAADADVGDRRVRPGLPHGIRDGIEHGDDAVERLPALPGCHAGHDLRAVRDHLSRVERAVPPRDPLHQQPGLEVDEDAHVAARATAWRTASSMSVRAEKPACVRILTASASFVPVRRITSGTASGNCRLACTMPVATSSPRVMPPKMLKRIAFTCGSAVMIRSASTTFCGLELPPMSRKLAGAPP